jgi:hypothetical protein
MIMIEKLNGCVDMATIFMPFFAWNHEVAQTKDQGIIYTRLSVNHDVTVVSTNALPIKHMVVPREEAFSGSWLPDCEDGVILIYFHNCKWNVPLYKKAKEKGYKIIVKADTDGHELQTIWNPFDKAIHGQLRNDRVSFTEYTRHWRKRLDLNGWALRRGFDLVDYILLESTQAYLLFRQYLPQFSKKYIFLPNGCDFVHDAPDKEDSIVSIGRWDDVQKAPGLLFESLGKAIEKNTSYQAYVIGPFDDRVRAIYECQPSVVRERLQLTGRLPNQEVYTYLKKSKVLVSSSWWESSGLTSLEGMSVGCSIACTPSGISTQTLGGLLGTASNGWSAGALTEAIENEIQLWDVGFRSAKDIIDSAKPLFDWNVIVNKFEKLIN